LFWFFSNLMMDCNKKHLYHCIITIFFLT
jgi:hypothetical protein